MRKTIMCGFIALAAAASALPASAQSDPLTAPIAPELAPLWLQPQAPIRVHGSTWLVGTTQMNVVLIDTGRGLILIDAGLPQAAPMIEANLEAARFSIADVKQILSSEPHYDHAGGLAALARDSGAIVVASAAAATVLRAGRSGGDDPQRDSLFAFPPVKRLRTVRDGETIRLGNTAITAHATPGHTPGSMSWTWRSCEGARCATVAFVSSLNSLTDGRYRYSDRSRRGALAAFRRTLRAVRALPCDVLITGHPDHSGGAAKLSRLKAEPAGEAFLDPGACRAMADRYKAALDKRLATERLGAVLPTQVPQPSATPLNSAR